jgi:hypothetical protein
MEYTVTAVLFGTGKRSESEICTMVADDLPKYHVELFSRELKENSIRDVWNHSKAVEEVDAQQVD